MTKLCELVTGKRCITVFIKMKRTVQILHLCTFTPLKIYNVPF